MSFFVDGVEFDVKESLGEFPLYILYSIGVQTNLKLVFVGFPDEFTSLEKISYDDGSSWFHDSIYFGEETFQIFNMFQDEKTKRQIKGFIGEGERTLQIADSFGYVFSGGMFFQKLFCNITSCETFEWIFL